MTALAEKIYNEALDLPTDERLALVDRLLHIKTVPTETEIESAWIEESHRRLNNIREGKEKTIPGDAVFEEVQERFRK
ncbi:hypothetical protein PDESU_02865 [Pontiella desulfatans]|uniref:Addiction module component n=1 Tax=Pontiella desulfatans TaxID=2750659 RepID=A0A6C2U4H8_PONDE|nr:addiction module protein [Pontiella desulfatans]VGO14306.1 hypothetical protein PDESU_02865 [Pontiella desulfatans]